MVASCGRGTYESLICNYKIKLYKLINLFTVNVILSFLFLLCYNASMKYGIISRLTSQYAVAYFVAVFTVTHEGQRLHS
jgi:hypothetical protein